MPARPNSNTLSKDTDPGTSNRCTLCDLPTPQPPVTGDDVAGTFCCPGCLDVYRRIDSLNEEDAAAVRDRFGRGTVDSDTVREKAEECFLHVSGMHCSACEAF